MLTNPSPIIWYAGMSDDVMSDDAINDYIIAKLFSFFLLRDELWVRSNVLEIFFKIISIDRPEQIFHFHPSKNSRGDSRIIWDLIGYFLLDN